MPAHRADEAPAGVRLMRSMLFVPGDSRRKFDKALGVGADALILDLEDSVAEAAKDAARAETRAMLEAPRGTASRWVRINALDTGRALGDLAATMSAAPDGIVLPKCESPAQVHTVSCWLDAFERAHGLAHGSTRIVVVATETAASLGTLGHYRGCSERLAGMMWGAEDLSASLGATENRRDGVLGGPFRLARDLCLVGAAAAGVMPIDTVWVDIDDLDGLRAEALQARRDGFAAKAAIHPKHVAVVNEAFAPSAAELDWAHRVMAALEAAGGGTARLDGKMVDKPHERLARRLLGARRD